MSMYVECYPTPIFEQHYWKITLLLLIYIYIIARFTEKAKPYFHAKSKRIMSRQNGSSWTGTKLYCGGTTVYCRCYKPIGCKFRGLGQGAVHTCIVHLANKHDIKVKSTCLRELSHSEQLMGAYKKRKCFLQLLLYGTTTSSDNGKHQLLWTLLTPVKVCLSWAWSGSSASSLICLHVTIKRSVHY